MAATARTHRMEVARDLEAELFVLMTLGDDRAVRQTYIAGEAALRTKLESDLTYREGVDAFRSRTDCPKTRRRLLWARRSVKSTIGNRLKRRRSKHRDAVRVARRASIRSCGRGRHIAKRGYTRATELFADTVGEKILVWVARNVFKRENGERRPPGLAQSFAGEASIRLRGCAFRSIVRLATTADTASATNRAPTQRTDVICSSHSDGAAAIPWKSRRAPFKPALASWVAFMRDPYEARCCGAAGAGRRGTGRARCRSCQQFQGD
jgi:hypothetical protein